MAGCGPCPDSCNCIVADEDGIQYAGSGDAGNPIVVPRAQAETTFTATSSDGSVSIAAGGVAGHSPDITVNACNILDEAAVRTNGRVMIFSDDPDCKPERLRNPLINEFLGFDPVSGQASWQPVVSAGSVSVNDTDSVDLDLSASVITANVITDPDFGIVIRPGDGIGVSLQDAPAPVAPTCENRIRLNTGGDITFLPDGITSNSITAGVQVSLTGTAGVNSANSKTFTVNNNELCPVYVRVAGLGEIVSPSNGAIANRVIAQQMQIELTGTTGGATTISGDAVAAIIDTNYDSVTAVAATISQVWQIPLTMFVFMPAGSTASFASFSSCLETQVGWTTTLAAGASFQLANLSYTVFRQRSGLNPGVTIT